MTRAANRIMTPARAWMLFDWATMPYFVLVTIFFFAPYFSNTVIGDPVRGQVMWAWIVGTAGVIVAVLAPIVGAWIDASGRRKSALFVFSILFVAAAPLLFFAEPNTSGQIVWLFPVIAHRFWQCAHVHGRQQCPNGAGGCRAGA